MSVGVAVGTDGVIVPVDVTVTEPLPLPDPDAEGVTDADQDTDAVRLIVKEIDGETSTTGGVNTLAFVPPSPS